MIKSIVETNLYKFHIILSKYKKNYIFEIKAKCNLEKVKSNITNINFLISGLVEPIIKFKDYESSLIVNRNVGDRLYKKAVKLFNNKVWLNNLFTVLEDDRMAGEWE